MGGRVGLGRRKTWSTGSGRAVGKMAVASTVPSTAAWRLSSQFGMRNTSPGALFAGHGQ